MVEKVFVNPNYDDHLTDYDFTLVKLARPVEINDHVAPACFPSESDDLTTTFPPNQVKCVSMRVSISFPPDLHRYWVGLDRPGGRGVGSHSQAGLRPAVQQPGVRPGDASSSLDHRQDDLCRSNSLYVVFISTQIQASG